MLGVVSHTHACSFARPPTFKQSLSQAATVFIFRIDQAAYRHNTTGPVSLSWAEAKITLVQNLYGDPTDYKNLIFHSTWCGELTLVVGRHYLIATNASGDTIELAAADGSLYEVEGFYNPADKRRSLTSPLIEPVIRAIYINDKLPDIFPPHDVAAKTVQQPPPPHSGR